MLNFKQLYDSFWNPSVWHNYCSFAKREQPINKLPIGWDQIFNTIYEQGKTFESGKVFKTTPNAIKLFFGKGTLSKPERGVG